MIPLNIYNEFAKCLNVQFVKVKQKFKIYKHNVSGFDS